MADTHDVTSYFNGLADGYDTHRPSYPPSAIEVALDGLAAASRALRVADVGAGTGIASRALAEAGVEVIAIEPNVDMRRRAEAVALVSPGRITYRPGTAETTGLDDRCVDGVLCAQAFHWFERTTALAEFHRIVRSGGRLILMWNVRQESDPLSAGYSAVTTRAQTATEASGRLLRRHRSADPTTTGHFRNMRTHEIPNPHTLDRKAFFGRARSASYYPVAGALHDELEAELARLFEAHQRDGRVVLDQVTKVILADRC